MITIKIYVKIFAHDLFFLENLRGGNVLKDKMIYKMFFIVILKDLIYSIIILKLIG